MTAIELKNVTFTYPGGESPTLKNVSLSVEKGELLVLCGQSGCGKTSIIRLINGLIPFYYPGELQGRVEVLGRNTAEGDIYDLGKKVSTVFQNPRSQFFCVDVMSELAFGAENQNIASDEILEKIQNSADTLGIRELLPRTMFQLSGGEKQKIACACVSVTDNPIVVLDEPSSNLDMWAVEELKTMIARWKRQGKTVVVAEHRLGYLQNLADRFLYVSGGEIRESYSPEDFRNLSPAELEARGLRALNYENLEIRNRSITEEMLRLRDFRFQYRSSWEARLDIPELALPKGAVIGIIGRNGAGKSTFVRNFCGLQKKGKGLLFDEGKKLNQSKRLDRSFLVMQDVNHQLFTQSVEEEITLSMGSKNQKDLGRLLSEFDLTSFREKHPMALSGGQKQRVAVASAIASSRDFVVFDEPTSGLDLTHMKQVAQCILDLQKRGKTVLLITHDLELLFACCSQILHMEDGKVRDCYALTEETKEKLQKFFLFS